MTDKELIQILEPKNIFSKNKITQEVIKQIEIWIKNLDENKDCKIEEVFFNRHQDLFEVEVWDCEYKDKIWDREYSLSFIVDLLNKNASINIIQSNV